MRAAARSAESDGRLVAYHRAINLRSSAADEAGYHGAAETPTRMGLIDGRGGEQLFRETRCEETGNRGVTAKEGDGRRVGFLAGTSAGVRGREVSVLRLKGCEMTSHDTHMCRLGTADLQRPLIIVIPFFTSENRSYKCPHVEFPPARMSFHLSITAFVICPTSADHSG